MSQNRQIDAEYLGAHGHISPLDAQNLHSVLMRSHGVSDPDEIIANWNRRDPDAPWGSGKVGRYIHELTGIVCGYMAAKIKDAGGPDVQCDLGL